MRAHEQSSIIGVGEGVKKANKTAPLKQTAQFTEKHGQVADCDKKYETLLRVYGWGKGAGEGISRTWPKCDSIPDVYTRVYTRLHPGLATGGHPCEQGGSWKSTSSESSVVTWNIINVLRSRGRPSDISILQSESWKQERTVASLQLLRTLRDRNDPTASFPCFLA